MGHTIANRHDASQWRAKHEPSAPRLGDQAPDFTLRDSEGESEVRLGEFEGKSPVALIFGSFT